MVLADTTVWVDHLNCGDELHRELLLADAVVTHRFVVGELACGGMRNRGEVLARTMHEYFCCGTQLTAKHAPLLGAANLRPSSTSRFLDMQ